MQIEMSEYEARELLVFMMANAKSGMAPPQWQIDLTRRIGQAINEKRDPPWYQRR